MTESKYPESMISNLTECQVSSERRVTVEWPPSDVECPSSDSTSLDGHSTQDWWCMKEKQKYISLVSN